MIQKFQRSSGTLLLLLPLLFLLFVIVSVHTAGVASRLLPPQTIVPCTISTYSFSGSDGHPNANKRVLGHDVGEIKEDGSWNVMELEDLCVCEDADEECLKRRMTYEAHLDYIYTQSHKP